MMKSAKRLATGILTLAAVIFFTGCGNNAHRKVRIDEYMEAELGKIREKNGVLDFILLARNNFNDTIVPVQAYTWCSCIQATLESREPVAPGEDVRLSVKYNPAYRSGRIMEEIQIYGNKPGHFMSLIVKGEVIPFNHPVEEDFPYYFGDRIHLSHELLFYGRTRESEMQDIFIRVANERGRKARISFTPGSTLDGCIQPRKITLPAHGRDTLHIPFTMIPEFKDSLDYEIRLAVNDKPIEKPLKVLVSRKTE